MDEKHEYITINEMIKRDLDEKVNSDEKQKYPVYQIQAIENENDISVVNVGEYSFIPITKILEMTDGKFYCRLFSMVIPQSDIENDMQHMISFFISRKKKPDKILSRLSYCYIKSEKQFCICIEKNSNIEMIEKYNKYHGNENIIYLLTEIILRIDVKKKIFN